MEIALDQGTINGRSETALCCSSEFTLALSAVLTGESSVRLFSTNISS
jgi:hypothetical protein